MAAPSSDGLQVAVPGLSNITRKRFCVDDDFIPVTRNLMRKPIRRL